MNTVPFGNLLYTFPWARLILEQIPLEASDLQELRREKQAHPVKLREIGSYAHLALGNGISKTFGQLRNFRLFENGYGVRRGLTLGTGRILL
jgi:hypothetical protein